jgi:flagellar motility protein MotE (MotC chaperone)
MKKIIMICALTCFFINHNVLSMFTKYSTLSKINITTIRNCNRRSQFDLPTLLQQLREQKRQKEEEIRRTQEHIKFMETLITNQPKDSTDENIATHWQSLEDRDFPQGNMHKNHGE